MGGLIARWYIEQCGGAEITSKLITLGTPYRGAARAIDQLVTVRIRAWPLPDRPDRFRALHAVPAQLMPEYACIDQADDLFRTTDVPMPELDTGMVTDAMHFHTTLRDAETSDPPA